MIATPHSRRTERLHQVTRSLAVACGGELGHRLASRLGIAVSPDTLLRDIRKLDYPPSEEPRVVGVDDWAYRRGERYGTLICNLENGHVVDLLPDRSVESWANWLKQHPTVMTVSRDRGDIYRKGTLLGAPEALQVADRFHLVKNLYESFCVYVKRQLQTLRSAVPKAEECAQYGKSAKTPIRPTQKELRKLENRQRRLALYNQIRQLHTLGHSAYSIARQCGIHRHTVCRYLLSSDFPERTVRSYSSTADSIKDYLRDRWNAGCRNVMVL